MIVDLTYVLTAHQLTNVIYEAAFRGRGIEPATRDTMARANGRHHLHKLNRAIDLYNHGSAGTRSGAEDAFLALDFPEPLVNMGFEAFEVDFCCSPLKLAVEVDGAHHARPRSKLHDAREDRTLRATGYTLLRFTDSDGDHRRSACSKRSRPLPETNLAPVESLSQSRVWNLQRAYYEQRGERGVRGGPAPGRSTIRRLRRASRGRSRGSSDAHSGLDPSAPLYVVELGAGAGRFAHGWRASWASGRRRTSST